MRYIILILLFTAACATEKQRSVDIYEYSCYSYNMHGVYAQWQGKYSCYEQALVDAEVINKRLIDKQLIPNTTDVMCHLSTSLGDPK